MYKREISKVVGRSRIDKSAKRYLPDVIWLTYKRQEEGQGK